MDWEAIWIYGVFCTALVLSIIEIGWTIYIGLRHKSFWNTIVAITLAPLNLLSCVMIIAMFMGAWPTILPLIIIGVTTLVILLQFWLNKKKQRQATPH